MPWLAPVSLLTGGNHIDFPQLHTHTKSGDRGKLNIQVDYKVKLYYLILYIYHGDSGHNLAIKTDYPSKENDGIHRNRLCNTISNLDVVT